MTLELPKSMDECVYYTLRTIGENGKIRAWVLKETCPKCQKGLMAKPKDEKTGKPKIRATEYVCSGCGNTVAKKEYEDSLTANIEYTCPKCKHNEKIQIPFKRKATMGTQALVFNCTSCNEKMLVTKKMKDPKKK